MKQPTTDLRHVLPRENAHAGLQRNRLLGLLHDRIVDEWHVDARLPDAIDEAMAQGWLVCTFGAAIAGLAPLIVGGRVPVLRADGGEPDGLALAATLDGIEPLLLVMERQFGHPLRPERAASACPPGCTVLRLSAHRPGSASAEHVLLAALPDLSAISAPLPAAGRLAQALRARVRLVASLVVPMPAMAAADLRSLAAGDLLLVGPQPIAARLCVGPFARAAMFAPASDHLVRIRIAQETMVEPIDTASDQRIILPAELRIRMGQMTLAEAAALTPGQLLTLPAKAPALPVAVFIGSTQVASGDLVALGDGYAVLVQSVAADGGLPDHRIEPEAAS